MKKVKIYSDWGARPNPGPWGYWTILRFWKKEKELSWFEQNTTNNRMELTGAIMGLKELKEPCEVDLYTDSSYVVNWIEKGWAEKWKANDWMRTKTQKAVNWDLWEQLLEEVKKHKVKFNWVRGHNWHIENERCDVLATNEILKNTPLNPPLQEGDTIEKYWENMRLSRFFITTMIKKYALKAFILKNISAHTLRHSFATTLLSNWAWIRDVQEMLGHSSITTTQVYTHVTNPQLKNAHKKFMK